MLDVPHDLQIAGVLNNCQQLDKFARNILHLLPATAATSSSCYCVQDQLEIFSVMSQRSKGHVPPPLDHDRAARNLEHVLGGKSSKQHEFSASWWNGQFPEATHSAPTSTNCGMDYYPPGGFMSILQRGQQPFVPHVSVPLQHMRHEYQFVAPERVSKGKTSINADNGSDGRTAKRLIFDKEEDERLASAWLIHSIDSINGNNKKNDSYWGDVCALYNTTTPTNRMREVKHLKDRWQKIKRWVGFFCASWKKATSIYLSGYSDEQLKYMAKQFYLDDYPKEDPFTIEHCWKILRDEPKWQVVLEELENQVKGIWMMKRRPLASERCEKLQVKRSVQYGQNKLRSNAMVKVELSSTKPV